MESWLDSVKSCLRWDSYLRMRGEFYAMTIMSPFIFLDPDGGIRKKRKMARMDYLRVVESSAASRSNTPASLYWDV